jgi:salicylate hydroxylase
MLVSDIPIQQFKKKLTLKVIGCDGIKSRVRQILLGIDNPQSYPSYTHKYAYRGLVPMDQAINAIGADLASNRALHMGKNGHVLTFPVAHGKLMNVVAFHHDPHEWKHERLTMPSQRGDAIHDFEDWGTNIKAIMNLLMDNLDRWAIFDLGANPLPFFNKGRVCIAGDAAHATGPHHGAGAGFCIEDSAILAELLLSLSQHLQSGDSPLSKEQGLERTLAAFDSSRRERTQWLVQSSRVSVDLYEWRDEKCGQDPVKIREELLWRNHKIWHVDLEDMAKSAREELEIMLK